MALKHAFAVLASATLVVLGAPAWADEYRPGELLNLDLSKAVLSPKRLGPPTEFAPVAVEARTESKRAVAEPKAEHQRAVRTSRITQRVEKPRVGKPSAAQARLEKPRPQSRTKLARPRSNPLDAQAMDRSIQTWPCKSGGICNWKP